MYILKLITNYKNMRVVREILPNGMPFIVQAVVEDGLIYPNKIKVFPILLKNNDKSLKGAVILEELPFENVKQREKLAVRLCKFLNAK